MKAPMYSLTNESISIVHEGKYHVIRRGAPNFNLLKTAILSEDWAKVVANLSVAKSVVDWARGNFSVVDGFVFFKGKKIPDELNDRIFKMMDEGRDPTPLFNFWEKLQRNPSMRSVEQLWPFLNHQGIPLTNEGNFLAYKSVRSNFTDHHTGNIDNSVGQEPEMPRNEISDDPNHACHRGLHVGALDYAESFSPGDSVIIICEVNPEHVVCIPYDHSHMKMRVCKYRVVGLYGERLSSTVHDEELPVDMTDEEIQDAVEVLDDSYQLDDLSKSELFEQKTETLRKYAYRVLGIVGASRIQGGKDALIDVIVNARKKRRMKL